MNPHWMAILGGVLLQVAAAPASAIDPPVAEGVLLVRSTTYELRYAQAVRNPDNRSACGYC
jgi:hypothetical protein